ncbi:MULTISPECIES: hypothetical protein [Planktothricoides]|uniref:TNase-like domain-containing protein n=2 Tax=Planktothricoides raciborskii TaxID=132608 RepID=A0AAU8JJY0_9CYAN|nr:MULTISPECIES: hypothetical protein [Planktothricoides]MBD2542521.1 hypothetical protein [Planktothricoides raciborskii FACHB-1370]MBD2580978.1 hypothetical protein [Planktothricoides raciborskii FACHB-1261]
MGYWCVTVWEQHPTDSYGQILSGKIVVLGTQALRAQALRVQAEAPLRMQNNLMAL